MPSGELAITDAFSEYAVTFDTQDTGAWHTLAGTLEAYARRDGILPARQGSTDERGEVSFTDLAPGVYLVAGEPRTAGGYTYAPEPILVCLPYLDENGAARYSVSLSPKKDAVPSEEQEPLSVLAVKVWNDGGREDDRPDKVTVELIQDGTVCRTAELTAANNWRCVWHDLAPGHTYHVTEREIPEGYTVRIRREGNSYIITNSRISGTPKTPYAPKLPQTGMLQWPVSVLSAAGLLAVGAGILMKKRNERE